MRLDWYIARQFIRSFLLVFSVFFGIVYLIDMVEQMRRFDSETVGLVEAAALALLKAPATMYRMLPLLTVLATISLFLKLSRTSEMVVMRASGRSALRTLVSPVLTAALFGALGVAALNPIVAATSKQFEIVAQRYAGNSSTLSISDEGLWLRQASRGGQVVIKAERSNLDGTEIYGVTFYGFDQQGEVTYRIAAERAVLEPGRWALSAAKRWTFGGVSGAAETVETYASLFLPSDLTRDQIQDSFGSPSAIPIWELPKFIDQLDRAGFSALQHRVWLNMELANPILLVAMVLIGAGFTMRHTRFGRTGLMVLFAILMGFSIYFLRNFAQVLGENGQIPIIVAAWMPPVAGILMSLGLLLHTEDG
ncbi:MAG: LPS export ABC transporter permease LptG [Pseudomonadota bacterium]